MTFRSHTRGSTMNAAATPSQQRTAAASADSGKDGVGGSRRMWANRDVEIPQRGASSHYKIAGSSARP
jgi:hypothetical protein